MNTSMIGLLVEAACQTAWQLSLCCSMSKGDAGSHVFFVRTVQHDAQECNQSPGILSKCDDNFASFVPHEMFRSSWRFFLLWADRGQRFRRATLLCRGGPFDVSRGAPANGAKQSAVC